MALSNQQLEENSKKIALNEKLIKPGSIVRTPLSSTGEILEFEGEKLPILESKSISFDPSTNFEQPMQSGFYYLSQNRHQLPVELFKKKGGDAFRIKLNSQVASKK